MNTQIVARALGYSSQYAMLFGTATPATSLAIYLRRLCSCHHDVIPDMVSGVSINVPVCALARQKQITSVDRFSQFVTLLRHALGL